MLKKEPLGTFLKGLHEMHWLPVRLRMAELVSAIVTLYVNAAITFDTYNKFSSIFYYNKMGKNPLYEDEEDNSMSITDGDFDVLFRAVVKLIFSDEKIKFNHLNTAKDFFEYLNRFVVTRELKRCSKEMTSHILGDVVCPDGKTLFYIDMICDSRGDFIPVVKKIDITTNGGEWSTEDGTVVFHNVEKIFSDEINEKLLFQLKYTNQYLRYSIREEKIEVVSDRILYGVNNRTESSDKITEEAMKEIIAHTFDIAGIMAGNIGVFSYTEYELAFEKQSLARGIYLPESEILQLEYEKSTDKGEVILDLRRNEFRVRCVPEMTVEQCKEIADVFNLPYTATTFYFQNNVRIKCMDICT